jgi:hypothetical protein
MRIVVFAIGVVLLGFGLLIQFAGKPVNADAARQMVLVGAILCAAGAVAIDVVAAIEQLKPPSKGT